ncbi:MAG: glutamyl-tRNA reductase [Lewinellaceae bacterium]|nr:glutamyl-tRNA reductase [Saprospiraceae bacterium]MCB9353274.1 glutamyl-tRNA reductase [Lewinellaceae bacterium]
MLDGYHILTITHRDAPLELIGQALVPSGDDGEVLQRLKAHLGWSELLYLSTCNRVMYLFYSQQPVSEETASEALRVIRPDLDENRLLQLRSRMRLLHGAQAVQHLFEVAGSLDSLVVGEREIIRQLREAYDRSHAMRLTGDHLRLLMRFTIETAKEIYSNTGIGEKALSVVALAFAEMQKAGLPKHARILLVGAGQTNTLFAKFLKKGGYHHVTVFNRSIEKAQAAAQLFSAGNALPLDALEHYTEGFDALIVCTGATQAIVTPELYRRLLAGDAARKIVVDLSVPNNVDKDILSDFAVRFIEVEGLRNTARENLAHREREKEKAEAIIAQRIYDYRALWHERQVERSLSHIPDEVRAVKDRAINEVFGKEFAGLDPSAQELMLKMMNYMEKKCVAIPMKAAKAIALHAQRSHHSKETAHRAKG